MHKKIRMRCLEIRTECYSLYLHDLENPRSSQVGLFVRLLHCGGLQLNWHEDMVSCWKKSVWGGLEKFIPSLGPPFIFYFPVVTHEFSSARHLCHASLPWNKLTVAWTSLKCESKLSCPPSNCVLHTVFQHWRKWLRQSYIVSHTRKQDCTPLLSTQFIASEQHTLIWAHLASINHLQIGSFAFHCTLQFP